MPFLFPTDLFLQFSPYLSLRWEALTRKEKPPSRRPVKTERLSKLSLHLQYIPGDAVDSGLSSTSTAHIRSKCLLVEALDEGDVKRRNRHTYLKQAEFFSSWCSRLGIQDPSLSSLPQVHRERVLVAYAIEISQGMNLKNMSQVSSKTVRNYLRAAASHALDNGQRDPRFRYTPSGLPMDGAKYFPMLQKLLTHMSKWSKGRSEALPLTPAILHCLHSKSKNSHPHSFEACAFDAICLGLQTGSRCSEYCCGTPTEPDDLFCKVPQSHYTGQYAGFPIAFIPDDISFLTKSRVIIPPSKALSDGHFVRVRFKFDKGGTGNLIFRTFQRLDSSKSAFCPLLAALRALNRWSSLHLHHLTPLFSYGEKSSPSFLHDAAVTKLLRESTIETYNNSSHLYRTRVNDIRTHSLRVSACLILVAANLPTPAIEHRLRWSSDAWKVYVRESLSHMDQASSSSFYSTLDDDNNVLPESSHQAFDADDLL